MFKEQNVDEDGTQSILESRLREEMLALEEGYRDSAATCTYGDTQRAEESVSTTLELPDLEDAVAIEDEQRLDSEATDEGTESTDNEEMATEEVNSYLDDLYENDESDNDSHEDDVDLLEVEDSPSDFPNLIKRLRQLRQSI